MIETSQVADITKYVNHELSVELDSSDSFEGPEKLLEIWLCPDKDALSFGIPHDGLRSIPFKKWEDILDHVQCKVLSVVRTKEMDAYVLSESSLFVYPHKVILKTCGTTTTLVGIPPMLDMFAEHVGFPREKQPWRIFYSRKSFMFPERQKNPHKSWSDEVEYLNGHFEDGSAYTVGNVNSDHWYLYSTVPCYFDYNLRTTVHGVDLPSKVKGSDETLEILMTDLSSTRCSNFFTERLSPERVNYNEDDDSSSLESSVSSLYAVADDDDPGHELGNSVTKLTGIDSIYPTNNQVIDAFCFNPCGYSCNGIISDGNYFTIHVTPERQCSYASFETNVPASKYGMTDLDVIERVINIFKPGKFSVTLFDSDVDEVMQRGKLIGQLKCYRRTEKIHYELDGYELVFLSFEAIRSFK